MYFFQTLAVFINFFLDFPITTGCAYYRQLASSASGVTSRTSDTALLALGVSLVVALPSVLGLGGVGRAAGGILLEHHLLNKRQLLHVFDNTAVISSRHYLRKGES